MHLTDLKKLIQIRKRKGKKTLRRRNTNWRLLITHSSSSSSASSSSFFFVDSDPFDLGYCRFLGKNIFKQREGCKMDNAGSGCVI